MEKLIKLIEKEEGWRESPYYCSEGYPTIGYGFRLGFKDASLPQFDLPKVVGDLWLKTLLNESIDCLNDFIWFTKLNPARQAIIISMVYQLGLYGVLKFKKMIEALEDDNFAKAASEMLDSRWADQTSLRANRHAIQLQSGSWHSYYS